MAIGDYAVRRGSWPGPMYWDTHDETWMVLSYASEGNTPSAVIPGFQSQTPVDEPAADLAISEAAATERVWYAGDTSATRPGQSNRTKILVVPGYTIAGHYISMVQVAGHSPHPHYAIGDYRLHIATHQELEVAGDWMILSAIPQIDTQNAPLSIGRGSTTMAVLPSTGAHYYSTRLCLQSGDWISCPVGTSWYVSPVRIG